jgi:MFS family permease
MDVPQTTYVRQSRHGLLRGPAMALCLMQLPPFIAIKSLGATESQAVLISMAVPVGNLLALGYTGWLARRRRVPFIVALELGYVALLFPIAFVTTPLVFVALLFGAIVLRTLTLPATAGLVRDNYPARRRGHLVGKVQAWTHGSAAASGLLFGLLLEADSAAYRYLYPLAALLALFATVQLLAVPEEDPASRPFRQPPGILDFFQVLRRDPFFLRYQISFFIFGIAMMVTQILLPLYMAQDLNANYQQGALSLVVLSATLLVLTSGFWGRLLDRTNMLMTRGVINLFQAMAPIILYFTHSIWGVYASQILLGLFMGGSMLVWTLGINLFARREEVPTYMAIHQALTGIRGIMAPWVALWLANVLRPEGSAVPGYREAFLACSIVMIIAGALMIVGGRQMARQGRATTFHHAETLLESTDAQRHLESAKE